MNCSEKYISYCKPELGKLLGTVRLDKVYCKADGDNIFYNDENGDEIKVTDFLGGYGASLFGHNNPELVKVATDNFKKKLPFNAQASCRGQAALLCEKLDKIMFERTNKNFITTLASTGTEAVEAAIKHAELYHTNRLKKICEDINKQITYISKMSSSKDIKLSKDAVKVLKNKVGASPDIGIGKLLQSINTYNYQAIMKNPVFISLERSFHGKTTGSVKLTFNKLYNQPFERIGIDVKYLSTENVEDIEKLMKKNIITLYDLKLDSNNEIHISEKKHSNVSALFIEPLQGEGGIHIIESEFLKACREVTKRQKIPLVFDEIQCGMGRTGTFLFSEQLGVTADYYLLSKSLGGGISKVSALLINSKLYQSEFAMIHSSTFAEDDHSSAIALKALDIITRDNVLLNNCTDRGNQLIDGLMNLKSQYPTVIKDVRGKGLMIGIEFCSQDDDDSKIFKLISKQKLLGYMISGYLLHEYKIRVAPTMSSNTTIRLEPSAYISEEACENLLQALSRLCEIIYKRNLYEFTKYIVGNETYGTYNTIESFRDEESLNTAEIVNYDGITKVAFMAPIIESKHLYLWDKSFAKFSEKELDCFVDKIYEIVEPTITKECVINSITGDKVHLIFIGLFLNSRVIGRHMKNKNMGIINEKVNLAIDIAKSKNCKILGFGGYTSIVTNNCQSIITDEISLTTGNSLTVAMGLEALLQTSQSREINLDEACFAAVGATGNIASVYSEMMSEMVPRLVLIGNKGREKNVRKVAEKIYENSFKEIQKYKMNSAQNAEYELKGVAKAIYDTNSVQELLNNGTNDVSVGSVLFDRLEEELKNNVPIVVTSDYSHLKAANLVLSASNSPDAVILPHMLSENPVVICDIAVPADVHESVSKECKNVSVIKGGLVKLPLNPDFTIPGMPIQEGEAFACMSETVLLGLSGMFTDFSFGAIDKIEVKKIMKVAKLHGFELGGLKMEASY